MSEQNDTAETSPPAKYLSNDTWKDGAISSQRLHLHRRGHKILVERPRPLPPRERSSDAVVMRVISVVDYDARVIIGRLTLSAYFQ